MIKPANPNQQHLPGVPYVKGSITSQAAAAAIAPNQTTLQAHVLGAIRATGTYGATDEEIEIMLSLKHQTASARRRELVQKSFIKDSGTTRVNKSGCNAVVWVLRLPTDPMYPKKVAAHTKKIIRLLRERAQRYSPPLGEMLALADEIEQRGEV